MLNPGGPSSASCLTPLAPAVFPGVDPIAIERNVVKVEKMVKVGKAQKEEGFQTGKLALWKVPWVSLD